MGRLNDIGAQFENMTKRAKGGRRLDTPGSSRPDDRGTPAGAGPSAPPPAAPPPAPPGGSLKDKLRDLLRGKQSKPAPTPPAPQQQPPTQQPPARRPAGLPSEATVQIEYSPRIDGDPDPGDVVWVWVPFEEDPTQGKDRPLVVIGRRGDKLVGVPLTTKQNGNEAQLEVGTGDWDPKRRVSYARIWRMMDIDESAMRREGTVLDPKRFELLVSAVDQYYDVAYPQPAAPPRRSAPAQAPSDDY